MARQLHLLPHDNLDEPRDWRLDDATRTLGLYLYEGILDEGTFALVMRLGLMG